MKITLRRILLAFAILVVGMLGLIATANILIELKSDQTYNDVVDIPQKKVGLLLGTAKYSMSGNINLYYKHRLNAAVELFKAGKVGYILVSGDNGTKSYDEPTTIKKDLIARGIPEFRIFLDYAGFRTLDSVVRCKLVFGEEDIVIISQQFHNERAIFLANYFGMKAIGFNAKSVAESYGMKTKVREIFARTKVFYDIILNVEPKYLGESIHIE